jgi:transcriptional antiterminator NusG
MNWYVAHVLTGKEVEISRKINQLGIKAITPKRIMREKANGKWKAISRLLFPSYIFFLTEMNVDRYYKLKNIPGIIRLLGDNFPQPIHDTEVNLLLRLTRDDDPLGISDVFVEGTKVIVNSGPLVGLEGNIVKIDLRRFRAKVNINLMGKPRIVELAVNVIKKSDA